MAAMIWKEGFVCWENCQKSYLKGQPTLISGYPLCLPCIDPKVNATSRSREISDSDKDKVAAKDPGSKIPRDTSAENNFLLREVLEVAGRTPRSRTALASRVVNPFLLLANLFYP